MQMRKIMKIQQQHTCKKSIEFFGRNLVTTPCLANSATTAGRTWGGQLSMTRIEDFAPAFRRDAMTGPMSSAYITMPLVSILHAISVVYTALRLLARSHGLLLLRSLRRSGGCIGCDLRCRSH